jgi:C-terminal processing protease CtpA/Prc
MKMTIRLRADHTVIAQARAEGSGAVVGDLVLKIEPEQIVGGIPYDVWRARAGTTVELDVLRRDAELPAHR